MKTKAPFYPYFQVEKRCQGVHLKKKNNFIQNLLHEILNIFFKYRHTFEPVRQPIDPKAYCLKLVSLSLELCLSYGLDMEIKVSYNSKMH